MSDLCNFVIKIVCVLAIGGCTERPDAQMGRAWTKPYVPTSEEGVGWQLFSRTLYPADFRRDIENYEEDKVRPLVIWTGVISEVHDRPSGQTYVVTHKYWDWMLSTDHHPQYVSDRGEGAFQCAFSADEIEQTQNVGQFVIAYGIPVSVDTVSGVINMECMKTRYLRPQHFSTDTWSYGRDFVEEGDVRDLRVLREDAPP